MCEPIRPAPPVTKMRCQLSLTTNLLGPTLSLHHNNLNQSAAMRVSWLHCGSEYPGGITDDHHIVRSVAYHYGPHTDQAMVSDFDIGDHRGVRAEVAGRTDFNPT